MKSPLDMICLLLLPHLASASVVTWYDSFTVSSELWPGFFYQGNSPLSPTVSFTTASKIMLGAREYPIFEPYIQIIILKLAVQSVRQTLVAMHLWFGNQNVTLDHRIS
jgi:hypothetical protein